VPPSSTIPKSPSPQTPRGCRSRPRRREFAWPRKTGKYLNEIAKFRHRIRIGYGEAAGQFLTNGIIEVKHADCSVLVAAYKTPHPVTVISPSATDIPHMHRAADGAALGAATHHDFRLFFLLRFFSSSSKCIRRGRLPQLGFRTSCFPEVFLKAVFLVRNLGRSAPPHYYRELRLYPALPSVAQCSEASTASAQGGPAAPEIARLTRINRATTS